MALARAVIEAGAFAFLAGGNKTTAALAAEIEQLRGAGNEFGVNLFAPPSARVGETEFAAYVERLRPEAEALGIELDPLPRTGDDEWHQKLALLLECPVAVVSVTFGLPTRDEVAALQTRGSRVLATVTSPAEALDAAVLGVDGLTVQGYRAGGHSAVHDPATWPDNIEAAELVRRIRDAVALPIIAAGGVDGPAAVRELLDAGAEAVAVGTMLLRTDEAGTSALHRASLSSSSYAATALTRAFTGRPARGLRNGFIDRNTGFAPSGYPEVHYLTRGLRNAALAAGDADRLHMWAGTGFKSAPEGPAAEAILWLAEDL